MRTHDTWWYVLLSFALLGSCDVKNKTLSWQWASGRAPEHRIVVRIESLESPSAGPFGLGRPPSVVQNLPDPVELRGTVLASSAPAKSATVRLLLPRLELGAAQRGFRVALGLLDDTCICIGAVPEDVTAEGLAV